MENGGIPREPHAAHDVEVCLLGPVGVRHRGQWRAPTSGVQRALLALLALDIGRQVSQDRIVHVVWGHRRVGSPVTAANVAVHRLRRWLRDAVGTAVAVDRTPAGYLLRVAGGGTDVVRFRRLVAEAHEADGKPAGDVWGQAVGVWRGPVMVDVPPSCADTSAAAQLERERMAATLELGRALLKEGHAERAVATIEPLAEANPLDEALHATLMETLAAAGRQAQALAAYDRLRVRLSEELGIDPSPQLREAHLRVLRQQLPETDAAGPEAADVVPVPPAVPAPSPPIPAQLPRDVSTFAGRDQHLRRLATLAAPGASPDAVVIVAITGTAGIGKTALAVRFAHQVRDGFADGQLYVNLRGYATDAPMRPIEAVSRCLRSLGVAGDQVPTDLDEASGLYRSLLADRHVLVVLDDADSAHQVRPLLPGGPGCVVLLTSRNRLGGLIAEDGAYRVQLDALTVAEGVDLLARILGQDRVDAEPEAATTLVELCAGLPLALRIVAANAVDQPHRPIADHVSALRQDDRLTVVAIDGETEAAVEAAFDLSYQRLDEQERRLFRLLGLVAGPDVTADAAAVLLGGTPERARRLLDRLATVHLIDRHAPGRYAFHDLLRRYARHRTQVEDDDSQRTAAVERLFGWYLTMADAAADVAYPQMLRLPGRQPAPDGLAGTGFADGTAAVAWLEDECANLVAAVTHAADHGPRWIAWRLADSLQGYFRLRQYLAGWLAVADDGRRAAVADGDAAGEAAARLSLSSAHHSSGNLPDAIEEATAAQRICRQIGWRQGEACALGYLGNAHFDRGALESAADSFAQALDISRQVGHRAGETNNLGNLALVHLDRGSLVEAADLASQALAQCRQSGSATRQADGLTTLGTILHALGRWAEAMAAFHEALALVRQAQDRYRIGDILQCLADVYADQGRYDRAIRSAQAALTAASEVGDSRTESEASRILGVVWHRVGDHQSAVDHHLRALRPARDMGNAGLEARALIGLAEALQHVDRLTDALDRAEQALALARGSGRRVLHGQALSALAGIRLARKQPDRAAALALQAIDLHRDTGHRAGEARTLVVLGHALLAGNGTHAAIDAWEGALRLFTDLGAAEAHTVQALIHAHGHRTSALGRHGNSAVSGR
ncbi:MAG TPA: BTAD domain-containing putative transcriptional regulator [Pilimelia sp.]|nr:BTAD domain-containing putative transcriptional regulator [Pilimelia sp.]